MYELVARVVRNLLAPTIERVARNGGACIAVGAGRVILVDAPAVLAAADRLGVAIVGVAHPPA